MCVVLAITFFFFNDTATTEIYTLSLHDALPDLMGTCAKRLGMQTVSLSQRPARLTRWVSWRASRTRETFGRSSSSTKDRKSTRLNSSHANISYAVFCLKKKN